MRMIFGSIVVMLFLVPSPLLAETKEIISEGTYNMGDGETPSVAESRALLKAKQIALEQAGTYVESYSKVKNITLTQDEIQVFSSGLMEVEILDKKRTIVGEGISFWVKIRAKVNPDKMEDMAKRVRDKLLIDEYKNMQANYEKSQKDIEDLKRQLKQAKSYSEKKSVEAKITEDERLFKAYSWLTIGINLDMKNEYGQAIVAFTNAITLNTQWDGNAYFARGLAYSYNAQYDLAIEDYGRAILLLPQLAGGYSLRADAYGSKGQHDKAITDYSKAISMDPNEMENYLRRGMSYLIEKKIDKAIDDFNYFISKNQGKAFAYYERAHAYMKMDLFDKSVADLTKAISIEPSYKEAYYWRGIINITTIRNSKAVEDFNAAISIDKDYEDAFAGRGLALLGLDKRNKARIDLQKSCDMGSKEGCRLLQQVSAGLL